MKILVPLNDASMASHLRELGADEFYMGFYDRAWTRRFGERADVNRMSGFGPRANRYSFEECCEVIAALRGAPVYVTLNAAHYTSQQVTMQRVYLRELAQAGAAGAIVSTPAQVVAAREAGLAAVASTMCGIYNAQSAQTYIDLGASRIILPRDLTLRDIELIMERASGVEYEAFLMRNGCIFSDSSCLGLHTPLHGSTCGAVRTCEREVLLARDDFAARHDAELADHLYSRAFHHNACGMCAAWRLARLGIASAKVVGRADDVDSLARDVALVRRNLQIAQLCEREADYLRRMELPAGASELCRLGFSCYYPEVRWGEQVPGVQLA